MKGGEGFLTENDLIRKCKKGNREAFNALFSRYQSQVINIAYGMLSDREDACDAAQEVFVKVYKSISSFNEKSSFSTWLYRITANTCSDFLRKRQRGGNVISINTSSDESGDFDIEDESPSVDEKMELSERQAAVRAAISELKEEHRIIITLCDIEGLGYDEIASILKIPSGTVKSRINRARSALKKILMKNRELFL